MTGDFKEIGLKEYLLRRMKGNYEVTEFWADRDISFSLEQGDMLGIIGSNGAGKSTLLKVVSGIMEPSKGTVKRKGTIAALLELGSGFDGDLTVRENTYLRGAMLGYTRSFMNQTYHQIIEFAELQDFQDRPFKQLSSGMKARLAFSIASLVRPDILILDEVLSVGDGAFREKSERKMREIIFGGATTILVSHSIQQIRQMCNKVLWLEKGKQVAFGDDVNGICDRYEQFIKNGQTGLEAVSQEERKGPALDQKRRKVVSSVKDVREKEDATDIRNSLRPEKRRTAAVLLVAFAVSLLIELLVVMKPPDSVISAVSLPDNASALYPETEYYTRGYDISGPAYIPNSGDPQMGFILPGRDIRTIIISFGEALPADTNIQVYYAVNNESLTAKNEIDVLVSEGSLVAVAELPLAKYTHIRLDINGTFTLSSIKTSTDLPEIKYTEVYLEPDLERFLVNFIMLACVVYTGIILNERRHILSPFARMGGKLTGFIDRHGGVCLIGIAAVLVLLQVNNSSMLCYNTEIPNNIASANMRYIGTPRSVRSDEYIVGTSQFFHNSINGKLSVPAITTGSASFIVQINNLITRLNPYYWGELFLPESFAFSWNFVVLTAFSIFAFYRLFKIITCSTAFSVISSLLIVFSPGSQWWGGARSYGIWCGFVAFFYDFFAADKWWKKALCAWGLVCCTSTLIQIIYPAWDVPLMYLFAFILIGIYATERKIHFQKTDIVYIGITVGLMLVVVGSYFISNQDAVKSQLETVYPGKRFSAGGGLQIRYLFHYLVAPFITWKEFTLSLNQSEISSFLHLFPIPTIIFFVKYKIFKQNKVVLSLVAFKIFCVVYMTLGIEDFLAKYTLFSYSTTGRMTTIWGFASFVLLLLECYYIVPICVQKLRRSQVIGCVAANASVVIFLIWFMRTQEELVEYIGAGSIGFSWTVICMVMLVNLLFFGCKKTFLTILFCITVVSGVAVNPVNFGISAIRSTPLAEEIRQVDEQNPGRWVVLDSLKLPKYVYAQGVDCLNYVSWPPRFDLYEPLDKSGEYHDIYNRYAHVRLSLTEEDTSFSLLQTDYFALNLNKDDLKTWNVRYIVCRDQELVATDSVDFECLYHDDLDNITIYEVEYKDKSAG